jgi:amino acid adenylation domain-containing protein
MKGTLNYHVLQQSLQQLFEQHTIFQTVFYPLPGMDAPIQVMGHHIEFHFPIIDLEEIGEARQLSLDALVMSLQEEPFDLAHGPLFRLAVFHLSAETSLLFLILPALCSDSSTLPLLISDLAKRYDACLSGQELAEEPLQYATVSAWQKQILLKEGEAVKLHELWKDFTVSQMSRIRQIFKQAGIGKQKEETCFLSQTTQQTLFEPCILPLEVGETVSTGIYALASSSDVSTMAVLLACWLVILWRLTDESQLIIGVACNGRNYEELAKALGLYTRFVPFSMYMEDDRTFKQILAFLEPLLEKTMKHQAYFSWPSASSAHNTSVSPSFFPVTFEYGRWPASFTAEKLNFSLGQQFCCTEPFILKLCIIQIGERLLLELHYDPQFVQRERIIRLASMLQVLLHRVVEQPQAPVGTLTLLTDDEQSQQIAAFKAPTRSLPTLRLHQLFEAHTKQRPNQLAVISAKEQLTYQQLNEEANRLARVLQSEGIGPNVLAGLCVTRSTRMLVGLLGILKAGGAYLPLDAGNPPTRLLYQLQESQATILLTDREMSMRLPKWEGRILLLEDLALEMCQTSGDNLPGGSEAEDLAYIIYTSGSTGIPKGVMIQQSSLVNYALALCEQLEAEPGWQYATVTTLAADLGNTAIFCALASGGCVQVLDYDMVTSAESMLRWAELHPIDVLKIVPSHLSALLAGGQSEGLLPRRALVLGGEVFPTGLLEQIRALGCKCEVYNHYGPTETTIGVLVKPLGVREEQEKENKETYVTIPLGKPITNTEVYVLNQHMQIVPVGITGELYIGGAGLAMGYTQQGGMTAERFLPHPYSKQAGARLYRTGDLARYNEKNEIEFMGRRDSQVKYAGYRIELAEIEVQLSQHPNIRDSVVVLREDLPGGLHLVGYIVPRKLPVPTHMEIQNFLRQHLPDYMVPSTFIYLKFLPLTANGKVDRRQLITADRDKGSSLSYLVNTESKSRTIVQPRDATEWHVLQIWEDVLATQPISIDDDFFSLGGHSLIAVRLISRLSKHFGQNLDLATLFQHPTIAALAVSLRQQVASEERSLVAIQPGGTRPPFFCVHPAGGTAFCYVNLARCLGPDQPFYGLQVPNQRSGEEALRTVEEMAASYLALIRAVQPQGPYLLGGWSAGGVIAFEMAQQLRRQGDEIGVLALIDSRLADSQERAKAMEEEIDLGDAGIVEELIHVLKIIPDDFDQRDLEEQLIYVVEQAKRANIIPVDTSLELVRRLVRTLRVNRRIVRLYVPQSYPYRVDYFASSNSLTEFVDEKEGIRKTVDRQDLLQCWRELAQGGMEVHLIPGNHQNIVDEPNVQVLADTLRSCIDRVCDRLAPERK